MKKYFLLCLLIGMGNLGCQLNYYLKGAYHQSKIIASRQSIEHILSRPDISAETKRKILLTQETKRFLEEELGLKKTKNYSSFVELDRDYVSWIVQAAPQFSIEPYLWHFPIVGSLPYKGYFSETEAQNQARDLQAKLDLDTYVRGVSAFSTLGWLRDPLLSSMMRYRDHELVELIIHESVHATLFIKSEAEFNESLATFIGLKGAELFYRSRSEPDVPTAELIQAELIDRKLFSEFLNRESQYLAAVYAEIEESKTEDLLGATDSIKPGEWRDAMLEKKRQAFASIQARFTHELKPKLKTQLFTGFAQGAMNNAQWIALQTYSRDLAPFEELYQKLNSDLRLFIITVKTLENSTDPAEDLSQLLKTY